VGVVSLPRRGWVGVASLPGRSGVGVASLAGRGVGVASPVVAEVNVVTGNSEPGTYR